MGLYDHVGLVCQYDHSTLWRVLCPVCNVSVSSSYACTVAIVLVRYDTILITRTDHHDSHVDSGQGKCVGHGLFAIRKGVSELADKAVRLVH